MRYTKFGAPYYDATIGRFTQADPSGKSANRYAYAGCSRVNNTDPTGLDDPSLGCIFAAAGVLLPATASLFAAEDVLFALAWGAVA
ncbi:RHS repeat-associated core domain-containing protein [Arthrobacter sp. M4]|uniref:RHS repeat-associated core domain-containing protein n=1 Tax=Arthrobacter sp. M4 TaxID=218160 RepID=UPI001CDB54B4|nr:RHS repeat-associated core domain-containing protein [Arthrobacter sp. M4]MCA4134792.1 hypothetical protein [Arthrobacter sp. M4]